MTDRLRRNVLITTMVLAAVTVGSIAVAALSPARFTIVVAFMIASIAVFWWKEHGRFRSTRVEVGADGVLRVDDGRRSSSIDLSTVDTIAVRKRTESGQSVLFTTPRWSIDVAGPDDVVSHPLAQAVGLFNADEDDLRELESGIRAHADRFGARLAGSPERGRPPGEPGVAPTASITGRFEWRPPVSPNADRRRLWYRIAYVGAAVAIAVLGITSAWGDWVGVVLSAITVPGIVLAFCGGIDSAIGRSRRFRIVVDDGVLTVEPGVGTSRIDLRGAAVRVDKTSHITTTADSQTRTVRWYLQVTGTDGSKLHRTFPSLGTTTTQDDYVALERELRRRT